MRGRRHFARTRTIITQGFVFGLLGAASTVVVAWSSALAIDASTCVRGEGVVGYAADDENSWLVAVCRRSTVVGAAFSLTAGRRPGLPVVASQIPTWCEARLPPTAEQIAQAKRSEVANVEIAHGWPAIALAWSGKMTQANRSGAWSVDRNHSGIEWRGMAPAPGQHPLVGLHVLPLVVIWPGFAINALFYAVLFWLLFGAPFALRRRRRIKRGLCPKCAYPVGKGGTSDVCTECGQAVASRTQ